MTEKLLETFQRLSIVNNGKILVKYVPNFAMGKMHPAAVEFFLGDKLLESIDTSQETYDAFMQQERQLRTYWELNMTNNPMDRSGGSAAS